MLFKEPLSLELIIFFCGLMTIPTYLYLLIFWCCCGCLGRLLGRIWGGPVNDSPDSKDNPPLDTGYLVPKKPKTTKVNRPGLLGEDSDHSDITESK